jgi:chromosome segregation ATPase
MAMNERQIQKEILRIKKEIDLLESSIQMGQKMKAEKDQENKRLEDDITNQEQENTRLADELEKNNVNITELDEEFKENQLKAGRIRKEMNMVKENVEKLKKEEKEKKAEIERLVGEFENYKKKIKEEKHFKESAEYNLRKTNAKIAEIQSNFWSKWVTSQIRKKAMKSGRDADDIERGKDDIAAYDAKIREQELAQLKQQTDGSGGDEIEVEVTPQKESAPEVVEEKKPESKGLDLDF